MIEARQVSKIFAAPRGRDVTAVDGVSFRAEAGEVLGILGPNGAGKTTLLRMLATIVTPTSGECRIDGSDDASPEEKRRRIGFLSGNTKLYGRLTGRESLRFFGKLYAMAPAAIDARIAELTEVLDMTAFLDRRCETYSTGQSQKVSIARVMLHNPPILILDEPTLGLDVMTSRAIIAFIQRAKSNGSCVLFSTHYMTEAETLCDRIGFIYGGKMMAIGRPHDLLAESGASTLQDAFVAMTERFGAPAA